MSDARTDPLSLALSCVRRLSDEGLTGLRRAVDDERSVRARADSEHAWPPPSDRQSDRDRDSRAHPRLQGIRRHLHELFAQWRARGEWFHCAAVVMKHIDWLCEAESETRSYRMTLERAQEAAVNAVAHASQALMLTSGVICADSVALLSESMRWCSADMKARGWTG